MVHRWTRLQKAYTTWLGDFGRVQDESLRFLRARLSEHLQAAADFVACNSPTKAFNFQVAYAGNTVSEFVAEGRKMLELCGHHCFVMGTLEDSISGIFEALEEGALTMQQGGGIGCDFSTLHPSGDVADGTGGIVLRPSRYRALHRSQSGPCEVAPFQSVGSGQRCIHGRGGR